MLVLVAAGQVGCMGPPNPSPSVPFPAAADAETMRILSETATPGPAAATTPDYVVVGGDRIGVSVFDAPELSGVVAVSDRGEVSLPLLGAVQVGGLTPPEIEAAIEARLRERYMRDPRVTVAVAEVRNAPIFVLGEVNRPGAYPLDAAQGMTVLQAVSLGEGLRAMAARDRAVVLRTVAGGERIRIGVNLGDVLSGKATDVALQPHDIVYIPTNTARSIGGGVLDALLRMVTFRTIF